MQINNLGSDLSLASIAKIAKTIESMLSGTRDVCRIFMCSEQLKDEVEQLLKLSFSMFNKLLHSMSTHMRVR